jgi:hypothetical protein
MLRLVDTTEEVNNVVTTTSSESYDVGNASSIAIQCVIDVNTPSAAAVAAAAVNATTDAFTKAAHGLTTGLKGQMTTTVADLPNGLSTATDYFVIVLTDNTFQLALSLSDAQAGTEIDLLDAGTGTHTFTPTALAGATVKMEKSNDNSNWSDHAAATNVTADATVWFEDDAPGYKYVRVTYTATAGRLSADHHILVKG